MKKVFAFDLGKTSIGYCVREGNKIKEINSIIIDKDHAENTSLKNRRHTKKTLIAHKTREKYLNQIWQSCGFVPISKNDIKFTKEFSSKNESTIYTSCLLRIALLQNLPLEKWQIYKALHNAIQRRGYDANLPWKTTLNNDDKYNLELIQKYTQENGIELIHNDEYKYPCYYEALRLGLWSEKNPKELKTQIINPSSIIKVRSTDYVAPRGLIEKELIQLWKNAQSQISELNKYTPEEFLYGDYEISYGSYINPEFRKYMGTENDWQGVLGQKIPRFSNRIIAKCKLLPKRNVCKANTFENVSFILLMKLKNLRITDEQGQKVKLNPIEINGIYQNWQNKVETNVKKHKEKILKEGNVPDKSETKFNTTITKKEIELILNRKIIDKIEPIKADISGRSSFCRRACQIMCKVILSGELYTQNLDIAEFVDAPDCKNGITEEEIRNMLAKIGDWNNLYIPDNRNENAENASIIRTKTDLMIGNITNPIVRNRIQIFRDLLLDLYAKYEKPDEVILEFVRDGADNSLFGRAKAQAAEQNMKVHEKENEQIKKELENADAYSPTNFDKLKLLKMQGGRCIYSGNSIGINDLDKCEIDHIYPRTMGGNDALYNRVLCYRIENQNKGGRTPYEWLAYDNEKWSAYVNRLNDIKKELGKKKFELLTSKPEDCAKLIESYNGLAETSHIAKVAQQLTAFVFGWGLQVEGEKRHIYVNNGSSTHAIRKRYGLNSILGDDQKKNRENDKHHALDAICISYSRDFKYNKESKKDEIENFNPQYIKEVIDSIMPYPYTHKKPLKANLRPKETIYGLRTYGDNNYITNRIALDSIEQNDKKIKTIIDETIKNDLLAKLSENMSSQDWQKMLKEYTHPTKKTKVKKVMTIVSEGELEKDSNGRERIGEFCDFGTKGTMHQFKHSKGHKGQILYYNAKGTVKVMPIYANIKTSEVKEKLIKMGCKLYNGGEIFYSGCLVDVPQEFNAGKTTFPAGIYKLRTIIGNGQVKLENSCGIEISTSVTNLSSINFKKYRD